MHELRETFSSRHIGPSEIEIKEMLDFLGYKSLDDLILNALPSSIYDEQNYKESFLSEYEIHNELSLTLDHKMFCNQYLTQFQLLIALRKRV